MSMESPSTMRGKNARPRRSSGVLGPTMAALCLIAGCTSPSPKAEAPAPAAQAAGGSASQAGAAQRYDLKGTVTAVDVAAKKVTVDHEAMPGFMGAMTMPYTVKDEQQLAHLKPGDVITAKAGATRADYWLEDIVVTGQAH